MQGMGKMHWQQGFRRFFLLFHFSFFCCGAVICRDGSRIGEFVLIMVKRRENEEDPENYFPRSRI